MDQARDKGDEIGRDFARLAAAQERLNACPLSAGDRETLSRLNADIASGLVLLLSIEDGCIARAELTAAAAPLELVLPANVMTRLTAVARFAALDLAALAEGVAVRLAAAQAEETRKNEKPRRRQVRPRLELVSS